MSAALKQRPASRATAAPRAGQPAPPVRSFSFTDFQTNNPTAPPPGNQLDSNFDGTNASIAATLSWAATSLNTDGSIRDAIIDENNLVPGLFDDVSQSVINDVTPLVNQASASAAAALTSAGNANSSAISAASQAAAAGVSAAQASASAATASTASTNAQASASSAATQASNAANSANSAAGNEALCVDYGLVTQAWAEHMPDTIPPNILAVMNITGDHWSSRWWANQAAENVSSATDDLNEALNDALDQIQAAGEYWQNILQQQTENALVGIQSLYLGAFAAPPKTDSFGNPVATGAMYFDLTLNAAYVWNGTAWKPLVTPAPAAITRYIYLATANQTVFTGPDHNGNSLVYNSANYQTIEVFHKGLLLTPVTDYTEAVNTITLTAPCAVNDIVQLMVATVPTVQLNWVTHQLDTSAWTAVGGTLKDMQGNTLTPNAASDVMISADGVWQQGTVDYTVSGSLLSFVKPLETGFKAFGLVIVPTAASSVPVPGLKVLDTSGWVFDGTATAFPLKDMTEAAVTPQTAVNLLISLNGVWQAATRDYTVSGSTVTFVVAPQPASIVFAVAGLPALMTTGTTTTTTTVVTVNEPPP